MSVADAPRPRKRNEERQLDWTPAQAALVHGLARREARTLSSIAKLELRVEAPGTEVLFQIRACTWCDADHPSHPDDRSQQPDRAFSLPLRKVAFLASTDAVDTQLPVISMLSCEALSARALMPFSVFGKRIGPAARVATRSVFWADLVGTSVSLPTQEDPWSGLAALDRAESWLDHLPSFRESGIDRLETQAPHSVKVLSACTRLAHTGGSGLTSVDQLLDSLRSQHFLSPHLNAPLMKRLNQLYQAELVRTVGRTLTGTWSGDHPF